MPERGLKILKLACMVLAALVVSQIARIMPRVNLLGHVVIPALPSLPLDKKMSPTNGASPNLVKIAAVGTNKPGDITGTNSVLSKSTNTSGSNLVTGVAKAKMPTNSAIGETNATNLTNFGALSSNTPALVVDATNLTNVLVGPATNAPGIHSNLLAKTKAALPPMIEGTNGSTNLALATNNGAIGKAKGKRPNLGGPPGMMMGGMGFPGAVSLPELPPEIKARVDRIFESEILAPAMRPQPMGLIGIAGDLAFLRSATGQTGMVKEGDTLGDLKLLHIGVNRVLVEQAGQKKELMIFEGYGGTSLLPEKGKNPE